MIIMLFYEKNIVIKDMFFFLNVEINRWFFDFFLYKWRVDGIDRVWVLLMFCVCYLWYYIL